VSRAQIISKKDVRKKTIKCYQILGQNNNDILYK